MKLKDLNANVKNGTIIIAHFHQPEMLTIEFKACTNETSEYYKHREDEVTFFKALSRNKIEVFC